MTFRAKLQQTILGIVAGTTAAVLVVAQSQNSASYRALVDTMFRERMAAFSLDQDTRLADAKKQAARLAESVRLFAALEEGDPETYNVAADELRLAEVDFFRLASRETGLMPPPGQSRAGFLNAAQESALGAALAKAALAMPEADTEPQAGFVALPAENGPELYRVLAMHIRNFDTTVGTLFLGQAVARFAQAAAGGRDEAGVMSLFYGGDFFIAPGVEAAVLGEVERVMRTGAEEMPPGGFSFFLEGVEHKGAAHRLNAGSAFPPAWLVSVFSLADLEARQRQLLWRVAGIGAGALALAWLLGGIFSRQLSRPIHTLVAATQAVRAGDLESRLPETGVDEFAALNLSFNEMTEGLALKERYHSVLSMVTDASVAEQMMAGKIKLGGEAREVSVMFCDIRGYTAMSAGRDPAEVIAILNRHMGALTEVVYRWHGVITQFAGDAIMAVFGAPAHHGEDAVNAARCALELLAARARLNEGSALPLGIGIGIATGTVVAGCIGAEKRADYTVVGERVNLAARLCGVAAAGQVVIDETTRARLPEDVVTEALPELFKLKGFTDPVPAWRVLPSANS